MRAALPAADVRGFDFLLLLLVGCFALSSGQLQPGHDGCVLCAVVTTLIYL